MCFGTIRYRFKDTHKIPVPDYADLLFGVTTYD
jgi:hypothetical protein